MVTQVVGEPGSDTVILWWTNVLVGTTGSRWEMLSVLIAAQNFRVHRYFSAGNTVTLPLKLIQHQWWEECAFSLTAFPQPRCWAFICVSSSDRQWNILGLRVSLNFYIDLRAQSSNYQTLKAVIVQYESMKKVEITVWNGLLCWVFFLQFEMCFLFLLFYLPWKAMLSFIARLWGTGRCHWFELYWGNRCA